MDLPADKVLAAIPAKRMLPATELATAVRFLLDPGTRYITGSTVLMDGGLTSV